MTETLRVALAGLAANKLRSGLTILGLMIGVGSVIVLIAVGHRLLGRGAERRSTRSAPTSLLVTADADARRPVRRRSRASQRADARRRQTRSRTASRRPTSRASRRSSTPAA